MEKINIKDARIASALKSGMPELYDGVFIMFHRKSDNDPLMVPPNLWANYQTSGEIADGVVIVEGGKILVVAPTESSLYWSSTSVSGGNSTVIDRLTALTDWNGKSNTITLVSKSECSSNNYAPGFCNTYSRVNVNEQGLTSGKWWLPSLGEMIMISANFKKINNALSLINGSVQISNILYWTSTDSGNMRPFYFRTSDSAIGSLAPTNKCGVRPVSTFIS